MDEHSGPKTKSMHMYWIIFGIFALVFFSLSAFSYFERRHFLTYSATASAEVVGQQQVTHNHYRLMFSKVYYLYPVVEFIGEDGKEMTIPIQTFNDTKYRKGDTIQIRYNPANPQQAYIGTFPEIWSLPLTFLIFGVAFLIGPAIISVVRSLKHDK